MQFVRITATTVFLATGGLQVVGFGAIAVQLRASKNATFRCRLNDGMFVDCKKPDTLHTFIITCVSIHCKGVDGEVFRDLPAGTYTLFIEATGTENTNEVAYDTVGPIRLTVGGNATTSEAIGK